MRLKTLLTLIAGTLCVSARAQTVDYSSGIPQIGAGNEMTGWIQANGFYFNNTTTFQEINFWDIETSGGYSGSITWQIYSDDSSGLPGTVLFSGIATPMHTGTGNIRYPYYENDNVISVGSVTLDAGGYWLGLHNGPLTTTTPDNEFYWEDTTVLTAPIGEEQGAPFGGGNWASNGEQHAFEIITVPEPEPGVIAGLGLLVVWLGKKPHPRR